MSYTSFRDQYLTEVEARLSAVNVGTATTNELLAAGALYKMAAAVAEADLIGPSALRLLAGMSGAQLESWLADIDNRDAFERILASPEAMAAVAASPEAMATVLANSSAWSAVVNSSTAMAAVAASPEAMAAVLANSSAWSAVVNSSTAMAAVAASPEAMAAVAASPEAMATVAASPEAMAAVWGSNVAADAVLTSSVARAAVYESDVALAALQAAPAQIARQIGISGRTVYASTNSASYNFTAVGARLILLRRWYSGREYDYLNYRRNATSVGYPYGVIQPGGSRVLYGAWANGSIPGTYTDNGSPAATDNDTANFVAACNGLRRDTWSQGYALHVRFILV